MKSKILSRMVGRWLLFVACVVVYPAMGQNLLALNHQSGKIFKQRNSTSDQQTLKNLLRDIEKKHDVSFLCKSELLEITINTDNVDFTGSGFAKKLQKVLKPYNLFLKQISSQQFAISGIEKVKTQPPDGARNVSATPIQNSGITTASMQVAAVTVDDLLNSSRAIPVTGTVVSRNKNNPLQGVNVSVKGTTTVTTTNEEGKFIINVPTNRSVLVFSYVGYVTIERALNGQQRLDIILDEDAKAMDEVVVIGYGTQKKVNLTGAVSSVNAADLENRPITSTSSSLQGLLPGVTIVNTNPRPGLTGGSINIRGIGTIGNSNPLVLVDGIEQNMDIINPDDIETVSVLKDAASAAIYGSRAANGVILITTKKGRMDSKPSINYSYYYGIQKPTAKAEFLGSVDYMELLNESQTNVGRTPTFDADDIEKARNGSDPNYFANTNWIDAIFKKSAPQQNHSVNINGGSGKSNYYLSFGRLVQDGLVSGDNFAATRSNVRLRLNTELIDRLKVDANIGYVDRFYKEPASGTSQNGGVIYSAHQISPLIPLRFTNGEWGYGGGSSNPVATATDGGSNNFSSQEVSANISGTLQIVQGLSATGQYGLVMSNSKRDELTRTIYYNYPETGLLWYTSNPVNRIDSRDYVNRYQNVTFHADFERKIQEHAFKILGGYSQEWNRSDYLQASRQGVVTESLPVIDIGTTNQLNSGNASHWAIRSLFGRANYSFKNRYLLEANFRYDGSSRFSSNNRWGTFPSVSAGWRISEESFMKQFKPTVSDLKLRASWGKLGNQYVSSSLYPYLSTLEPIGTMPIGGVLTSAFAQRRAANPNLSWESVDMKNIGIDAGFLNSRLSLTFDYFVKVTDDILLTVPLPDVLGVSAPPVNAGSVENKGWEFNAGWSDRIGQLKYKLNFNISDVKNKVTDLGGVSPTYGDQIRFVGQPINAFYGLVFDGISQADDYDFDAATNKYTAKFPVISGDAKNLRPGDIKYKDLNKDGVISLNDDREVIGNPFPRYTYAFRTNFDYKGFDFGFFLQGVGKGNGYILGPARHAFINESSNPQKVHLDRWTPDNTDASYPRLTYQQSHNQRFSDFWLEDASYLRLKNIQAGYTVPASLTNKVRVQKLRVYISGDNLLTKTNFFYAYDPETPVSSGGFYPQVKTIVFGINVNFR